MSETIDSTNFPCFLGSHSRMAEVVRTMDWSDSPFGSFETWPVSLKTALAIMLGSASPNILLWGPQHITFYNDAYLPFLGPEAERRGIGQPYETFQPEVWESVQPYVEAAMSGEGKVIAQLKGSTRRNGFDETVYFTRCFSPVCGEDECIAGVLGTFYETTTQIHLQAALEAENKRFRELFSQAPVFFALTSTRDYRFEYVNEAFEKLSGRRELIGKTFEQAFPEMQNRGFKEILDAIFDGGPPVRARDVSIELRMSDGLMKRVYVDLLYQPVVHDGEVTGILCVGNDVTEQHAAEEASQRLRHELHHASRVNAMGTMATTLAHELNQPLAAAGNYLAGCKRLLMTVEGAKKTQIHGALLKAEEQIRHTGEIIRRARNMVSSNRHRRELVSLEDLVEQATELVKTTGGFCDADIQFRIDEDAAMLLVDPIQIEQVLLNLIRNACQAMVGRETRELRISSHNIGDAFAEISVRDTGPGLAHGEDVMFTAFSESTNGGLGVGLSLSQTIIEAHGGRMWARNLPEGGALMSFTLPMPTSQDMAALIEARAVPDPRPKASVSAGAQV